MVRAPCCEKTGLKKGPWSTEEDKILTNFIHLHGHGNWRALPKKAGLLRCGKSCRLRWTNYLRPDIKRGDFSNEEEETIIKLHGELGNRWSAIAAQLPGRTDNEIKNVWHTNLKKRLVKIDQDINKTKKETSKNSSSDFNDNNESLGCMPTSQSSSEMSTMSYASNDINNEDYEKSGNDDTPIRNNACLKEDSSIDFLDMDEDFWSELLFTDNSDITADEFQWSSIDDIQEQCPLSPLFFIEPVEDHEMQWEFIDIIQDHFSLSPLPITMEPAQDNDFQRDGIQEHFPSSPLPNVEPIQENENQKEFIGNTRDNFTSSPLSIMEPTQCNEFQSGYIEGIQKQFPSSPLPIMEAVQDNTGSILSDNLAFWFEIFTRAEEYNPTAIF